MFIIAVGALLYKQRARDSVDLVPRRPSAAASSVEPEVEVWRDMLLEEYKSLRQESLSAMQNQHATIRYSITAFGFLFGFGFTQMGSAWDDIMFLLAIPGFAVLSYGIYAVEFSRMVRVGRYIEHLEVTTFPEAHAFSPRSETWLGTDHDPGGPPRLAFYIVVPGFFFGVVVVSLALYIWRPCFADLECGRGLLLQVATVFALWSIVIGLISISLIKIRATYTEPLAGWRVPPRT